ncbi:acyl-CoA thioesterase-1 [Nocardioides ginsengisegetis]|uniref:Acyl-CoA thioesterase-1 n=1 Tax=Nocardioides ginsengisegetis TaxID=661491 RepID=A0A7W3J1Z8_9ACTN|nr:SGNH/GDSL hydrolase family protein [Nocardioides ginsengisegetis]MBA8804796.1 acyl-CoA thioesterase-1 [Nocardioides ginsengisegetis]
MGALVATRRGLVVGGLFVVLVVATLSFHLSGLARGADASRCERYAAGSVARAQAVTGAGERVVVIGDSYSAGLGLSSIVGSWPSRLSGQVHVAGFSGSGFSEHASPCGRVSFADRAPAALRGGADLVVVEGGLNDFDQPASSITAGFTRLMAELDGHRVVVVGPVAAPSRAAAVPRVDALLAELCADYDVPYVRTSGLRLPYLDDRLHLTPTGHRTFGDFVATQLAD